MTQSSSLRACLLLLIGVTLVVPFTTAQCDNCQTLSGSRRKRVKRGNTVRKRVDCPNGLLLVDVSCSAGSGKFSQQNTVFRKEVGQTVAAECVYVAPFRFALASSLPSPWIRSSCAALPLDFSDCYRIPSLNIQIQSKMHLCRVRTFVTGCMTRPYDYNVMTSAWSA